MRPGISTCVWARLGFLFPLPAGQVFPLCYCAQPLVGLSFVAQVFLWRWGAEPLAHLPTQDHCECSLFG